MARQDGPIQEPGISNGSTVGYNGTLEYCQRPAKQWFDLAGRIGFFAETRGDWRNRRDSKACRILVMEQFHRL